MPVDRSEYLSDTWKDGIFNNKVVFCTGGAGTICSAQVRAMVYLGANACIVGRNVEKTERMAADIATARPGSNVLGFGAVDVRSIESLNEAATKCVKELGGIDFVIAGAAGNFLASINQLSPNALKTVMDIDVLGSYNTLKATIPYLVESAKKHNIDPNTNKISRLGTGGRIIFVSASFHYTGMPFQTHVSVAKAGVDALANNVALEFGPFGVTSNAISPGPIEGTEGMERLLPRGKYQAYLKSQPLGRIGTVRDIADATVYLFSSTGNYVNGHALVVDGASWRINPGSIGGLPYPELLLSGQAIGDVKGQKKSKL